MTSGTERRGHGVTRLLKNRVTVAAKRSLAVRESLRFLARETGGRQGRVASYSLRRYDAGVALRHRTRDLEIFHELVVADAYHPPAPVIGLMTTLRRPVI